jgi:hypothetical protein
MRLQRSKLLPSVSASWFGRMLWAACTRSMSACTSMPVGRLHVQCRSRKRMHSDRAISSVSSGGVMDMSGWEPVPSTIQGMSAKLTLQSTLAVLYRAGAEGVTFFDSAADQMRSGVAKMASAAKELARFSMTVAERVAASSAAACELLRRAPKQLEIGFDAGTERRPDKRKWVRPAPSSDRDGAQDTPTTTGTQDTLNTTAASAQASVGRGPVSIAFLYMWTAATKFS